MGCAVMSKDPNTQVGAVLVGPTNREVRSTGFNGLPRGLRDTRERLEDRDLKNKLVVHAEMNAILNAARIGVSTQGCVLYFVATDHTHDLWGGPPCTRCTVELIQAGVREVVSLPQRARPSRWHEDARLARSLLIEAGVVLREVSP